MFVQHSGFCAAEKLMLFHIPCFAGDPSCFWGARRYLYFKYRSHPPSKWQKKKIWDLPVGLVWGNDWKMKKTRHFFPALDVEADDKPGMKESLFHQWITDSPGFGEWNSGTYACFWHTGCPMPHLVDSSLTLCTMHRLSAAALLGLYVRLHRSPPPVCLPKLYKWIAIIRCRCPLC